MAFFAKTFFFINEQLQKIKFEIKIFENICWGPQNGQNGFAWTRGKQICSSISSFLAFKQIREYVPTFPYVADLKNVLNQF